MAQSFSESQRRALMTCESMEDIYKLMGKKSFLKKVEEFDELNKELLVLFNHHSHELKSILAEKQKGLVDELLVIAEKLYWRKSR